MRQTVTVTLTNVHDTMGNTLASASSSMGILIGDVTGDGTVGNADIAAVNAAKGQQANASNFRDDVTLDGRINNQGRADRSVLQRHHPPVIGEHS